MPYRKPVVLLVVATLWSAAGFAAPGHKEDRASLARAAVQEAMPLLQSSADTWFERRRCPSCHHQFLGLMAMSTAREGDVPLDEARLANLSEKLIDMRLPSHADAQILGEASINEAIGQSYWLLGVAAAGAAARADYQLVVHMLAGKQHVSGKWSSYSHRPPLEDSEITATALSLRALRLYPPDSRAEEMSARVDRASEWLLAAQPVSSEERSMQILGLLWAGADSRQLRPMTKALLSEQRSDGGWAQIPNRESDAYATGQALVTLQVAGGSKRRRTARAIDFLLDTQQDDGTWLVTTRRRANPGLPFFESGFPHGKHQFISYAGSAWATMALLVGVGGTHAAISGEPPDPREPVADGGRDSSAGLPPLLLTAVLDSLAALEEALAAGADPNTATANGLTALHCAAHDPAKVTALLAAGARPDPRTEWGHTPLLVAAGYDGAQESVRLLLAAGADVNASTSRGIVVPATPFLGAVMRGDLEVAALLLERGARITASERQFSPLLTAVVRDDEQMVAFLIDRGAPTGERMREGHFAGETALMVAANGRTAVARLLVKRGADVNARNDEGHTALMFAAGASDRGTTEMVDILLAAGADPNVKNDAGATALALASEFQADTAAAALEKAARRATAELSSSP